MGASAREIKGILYDAAQNPEFKCLSPHAVLWELEEFIKRRTAEYDFLKQDVKDGYHDSSEFINTARNEWIAMLDQEVRESMGIFESRQYEEFLKKYIMNVSSLIKKEKIKNVITGRMESPDMSLIEEFEQIIEAPAGSAERDVFRNNVISTIGAYALDHSKELVGGVVDYRLVFPEYMKKLEDHYFTQQKSQIRMLGDAIQFFGTEKEDRKSDHHKLATETIARMVSKFSYCESCAQQSILYLMKARY
ncbi:MAG: hypothetical protein HY075_06630 [Deltaproteobacteria bacterium]|nr:hypothetical protein [Deltaproteobacteria bacterium]